MLTSALLLACPASAQTPAGRGPEARQAVTAASTAAGIRFVAPGEARRVRLEAYTSDGSRVFDSGFRMGGIYDWDGRGLADGSYLCVLTAENVEGRRNRRLSVVTVDGGRAALGEESEEQLKTSYAPALSAAGIKAEDAEAAARAKKTNALTVTAHDGTDGQVTSTSGALTFRTGDTLTGADAERMRVTADGRVGIGTGNPEATLDVAGAIRARGGIRFEDGTVLTSAGALKGSTVVAPSLVAGGGGTTVNAAGAGTSNNLAKWLDGAGTLGDSAVSESGGNVGIGTPSPAATLDVNGTASVRSNLLVNGASQLIDTGNKFSLRGDTSFSTKAGYMTFTSGDDLVTAYLGVVAGNHPNPGAFVGSYTNQKFFFRTNNTERAVLDTQGNFGVGTLAPTQRLEVAGGNLKVSGAGNGIIFPDGSKQTSAAASVSGQNAWTGQNTFVNGLSANGVAITNVGNPVSATDAVNKSYVDSGFVRFGNPGSRQTSVGDTPNGSGTMINLRGQTSENRFASFQVYQNGTFIATGNLGVGVIPASGAGLRTMWHPSKAAFRSGAAENFEWDDGLIGLYSWAGGYASVASGNYSFAIGNKTEAAGVGGFAAGEQSRACHKYGVAMGFRARSGGPTESTGMCDIFSSGVIRRGLGAFALGYEVTADAEHSFALGTYASAGGYNGSFVWGDATGATNNRLTATAENQFLIRASGGVGINTNAPRARLEIAAGANGDGSGDPRALAFSYNGGGFRHWVRTRHNGSGLAGNSIDFFVNSSAAADGSTGPGQGSTHVMSLNGGKVGVGTQSPAHMLHVIDGANAGLRVETMTAGGTVASFGGSGDFNVDAVGVVGGRLTVQENGNVGIGHNNPGAKLVVAGNVVVQGSLSKLSGTFKIDHPLDPANKYLYHSFVESPDMMNVYNGNVKTDRRGGAVVTMPDYFEALNGDYRYQLTVIGQFAQAIVLRKMEGNRFIIKTDKPNVEVSWQVTGIRQDAYARDHRVRVEVDKSAEERGTYLYEGARNQAPAPARAASKR